MNNKDFSTAPAPGTKLRHVRTGRIVVVIERDWQPGTWVRSTTTGRLSHLSITTLRKEWEVVS